MKIEQIRNATIIVTYGGKRFLIDPMFAPKDAYAPIAIGPNPDLRWPTCDLPRPANQIYDDIDVIIVTHLHPDHFDQYAIDNVRKGVKVFAQDEIDKEMLVKWGFTNMSVMSSDVGSPFAGIRLYKTPCRHGDKDKASRTFNNLGMRYEAMGVVFKFPDEKTLYLTGDTIWCDEVMKTIDKYEPDYIIANCADAQTDGCGSIIMGAEGVKSIHEYAPNVTIIASHMDCVGHAALSRKDLQKFAKSNKFDKSLIIPKDGQILEF